MLTIRVRHVEKTIGINVAWRSCNSKLPSAVKQGTKYIRITYSKVQHPSSRFFHLAELQKHFMLVYFRVVNKTANVIILKVVEDAGLLVPDSRDLQVASHYLNKLPELLKESNTISNEKFEIFGVHFSGHDQSSGI
jgi:hypothetical protein